MTQPVSTSVVLSAGLAGIVATLTFFPSGVSAQAPAGPPPSPQRQVLDRYCAACHNEKLKTAGLNLVQADLSKPGAYPELWEKVVRKVRTGVMPPANMAQPSEAERLTLLTFLETSLDAASAAGPNPGRTETLRRLNRTEYQNAIRDLLALDIDAASLLPADESGHGFDNVTVGDLSPTLLNRYISAAQKISRLAMGSAPSSVQSKSPPRGLTWRAFSVFFPSRLAQNGVTAQCAEPVTGSSGTDLAGAKKRDTQS